MTLESLWNTRKLTDEPYNWLTKTAAPPWVIHLARHSYEYAALEKASVEEDIEAYCPDCHDRLTGSPLPEIPAT
jgi:hypothetical protein